jgi:hypothetical protein
MNQSYIFVNAHIMAYTAVSNTGWATILAKRKPDGDAHGLIATDANQSNLNEEINTMDRRLDHSCSLNGAPAVAPLPHHERGLLVLLDAELPSQLEPPHTIGINPAPQGE